MSNLATAPAKAPASISCLVLVADKEDDEGVGEIEEGESKIFMKVLIREISILGNVMGTLFSSHVRTSRSSFLFCILLVGSLRYTQRQKEKNITKKRFSSIIRYFRTGFRSKIQKNILEGNLLLGRGEQDKKYLA